LIKNFQNFAHSSLNSPITQINTNIENKYLKNQKKIQKPVGGVFSSQDWPLKKPLPKRNIFYKRDILRKHPQIAKNGIQSLKK